MIPIAFYAPLKSPDHTTPSGDRTMGRLLLKALHEAGFAPRLASELRTLDMSGNLSRQRDLRAAGEAEADRLVAEWQRLPARERPRAWFTYHCYYKAPDWTGPRVADALGIPYVVAEGSRSARRATGAWAVGHAGAEAALDHADALFIMTPADAEDLEPALRPGQRLVALPPFLDASAWMKADPTPRRHAEEVAKRPSRSTHDIGPASFETRLVATPQPDAVGRFADGPGRLLTVAMMRPGDKLASYRLLAEALTALPTSAPWSLDIVGDGPFRHDVEAAFAPVAEKVRFHGAIHDPARLAEAYRCADLFVWPAIGEAYGMTLLEAQACGCPVLAGREKGVEAVVRDGETGILAPHRDATAFAEVLRGILAAPDRLAPMREAAAAFVRDERDVPHAAAILGETLMPLLESAEAVA